MEKWRLICSNLNDPYLNMAIEEALLIAVSNGKSPSTLRFWQNSRSVVIGRSQNVIEEVNLEECKRYGVEIVRRFTGGGAVYHDLGNLNWTFVIRGDSKFYPSTLSELYERACNTMVKGLKDYLNINAEFIRPNSIFIGNKKVSGSAAYVKKGAALCHGTLLIHANLMILTKVLTRLRYNVTNIRNETENSNLGSLQAIKNAILQSFRRLYGVEIEPGYLSKYEATLSKLLYREKYSKTSWNLKGTIPQPTALFANPS